MPRSVSNPPIRVGKPALHALLLQWLPRLTPEGRAAMDLLARTEGILLDPVYSGKGMAGLIDLVRKGHFKKDENVVFLHTGGAVALFGYPGALGLATA